MFRNWKNLLLIITFDVLFVLLISNLRFIQISIDNIFFPLFVNKTAKLMYSITYVIFELFLVIFTYSFFKFIVMGFIQKSFKKSEFNLKGFFYFFKLNLIIIMPLIILFVLVLNLIIKYFNNLLSVGGIDPFKFVFIVLAIGILFFVLFIYFYTFINILHFSFLKEQLQKVQQQDLVHMEINLEQLHKCINLRCKINPKYLINRISFNSHNKALFPHLLFHSRCHSNSHLSNSQRL